MFVNAVLFRYQRGSIHLIDIWMENAVDEAYAWALIGVLVWKLYMDFPKTTLEWCYRNHVVSQRSERANKISPGLTFFGSLESNVEFLPGEQIYEPLPSKKM